MSMGKTLSIVVTVLASAVAPVSFAETPVLLELGYGRVPVNSPGAVAAAKFAASAKSVDIKKILVARQAETADLYFIVCMRVAESNKAYLVEAKVSRSRERPYTLDAWTPVKVCK